MFHTDLYGITAEEHSLGRSNVQVVQELIAAGITVIQYREKEKKKLYKFQECQQLRKLTQAADVKLIINDDIDLALAVGADGVHVGQEDLPVEEVRKLVGSKMFIGLSTHSPEQAEDAVRRGADYIGVGPLFATKTKKDVCDPVGLVYLEYVVKNLDIPFVAIGGIKEHNVQEVVKRISGGSVKPGAACIALVTELVGAPDIAAKVEAVREKIKAAI